MIKIILVVIMILAIAFYYLTKSEIGKLILAILIFLIILGIYFI